MILFVITLHLEKVTDSSLCSTQLTTSSNLSSSSHRRQKSSPTPSTQTPRPSTDVALPRSLCENVNWRIKGWSRMEVARQDRREFPTEVRVLGRVRVQEAGARWLRRAPPQLLGKRSPALRLSKSWRPRRRERGDACMTTDG